MKPSQEPLRTLAELLFHGLCVTSMSHNTTLAGSLDPIPAGTALHPHTAQAQVHKPGNSMRHLASKVVRACSSYLYKEPGALEFANQQPSIAAYHVTQLAAWTSSHGRHLWPTYPWAHLTRGFASQPEAASSSSSAADGELVIDTTAVQRLKQLQAQHPEKPVMLRIEVEGGGCSGFQYKFSLDSETASSDKVFQAEGVRVVCDPVSFELLRGSRVEFEDSLMRSAFIVGANPNSEASCGCGSSFTAKTPKKGKA